MSSRPLPTLLLSSAFLFAGFGGAGCNSNGNSGASDLGGGPPAEAQPGCSPLVGDDCLSPFPSSFYEKTDATTKTGLRVAIPAGVLPTTVNTSIPISPARANTKDGWSPATPFLVYFKGGVDASQLPTADHPEASLLATSPVQVLEYATGARVPTMAELDANAGPGDRQGLIIRPVIRLKPSTRYVVALVGLKDGSGAPLAPAPFVALRDKTTLSQSLTAVSARMEQVFAALDKAEVPRASLTLAWDVDTGSDEAITSRLVNMVDTSLAMADDGTLTFTTDAPKDTPTDANLLREVTGTFQVPSWLASDAPDATLNFASDGVTPMVRATTSYSFTVHVPQCAKTATAPLPVFFFGHGLFGSANGELNTPYLEEFGQRVCMVEIGTDWIGVSGADVPTITSKVVTNMNNFVIVTDRLQQAHVNAQVFTRLFLTRIKDDPSLALGGKPVTDGKTAYYYGISNGGIQGGTYLALSKAVNKAALNVPGGDWSLLMYRSSDFHGLKVILDSVYPDPFDQQTIVALTQFEWDFTDPYTYATHLLANPLAGRATKQVLYQESEGDAQVSNLATRAVVRTVGVPGLDLENPVYGITQMPAPLASAYTQWDVHPSPLPPAGNVPPPMDNQAHGAIRLIPELQDQIKAFLMPGGEVTSVCKSGPCVFPVQ